MGFLESERQRAFRGLLLVTMLAGIAACSTAGTAVQSSDTLHREAGHETVVSAEPSGGTSSSREVKRVPAVDRATPDVAMAGRLLRDGGANHAASGSEKEETHQALRYFGQTDSSYRSRVPYGNNPAAGHHADSDGTRIYYEVYGQGEPVVILHGGLVGSMAEMGEFIDRLSGSHQVIAIATRGHGKSEIGHETPSYARKARDVLNVLNQVTKQPVTVIGFSDGAYTGYFLAAEHPARVKKLVAIGAGEWKKGFRHFGGTFADVRKSDPAYWQQQMQIRPEPGRVDVWYQSSLAYFNSLVVDKSVLGRIRVPVLVMAGEDDANAPLGTVIAAWRMIPHAQLAIIPGAPHAAFLVNFPAVWASMQPFLAR